MTRIARDRSFRRSETTAEMTRPAEFRQFREDSWRLLAATRSDRHRGYPQDPAGRYRPRDTPGPRPYAEPLAWREAWTLPKRPRRCVGISVAPKGVADGMKCPTAERDECLDTSESFVR